MTEPAAQPDLNEALDRLWNQFLPQIEERVATLETASQALSAGELSDELRDAAHAVAHKLAGILGTFGLTKGPSWRAKPKCYIRRQRPCHGGAACRYCSPVESHDRYPQVGSATAASHIHSSLVLKNDPSAPQLGLSFEERHPARRIWPVRELVSQVRDLVEQEYGDVWVEGEISNFRPAPSGHMYFTLKDAEAQLPVVLFRSQARLLRFRPEDGLHVLVRGRVSVYEQRGQMQLVGETMEPVGAGSLQLAFEQLKEKLKAEGLFNAARKRPLPPFPRTVGIVTSPTGAVIRDFLNIVARRHSGLNVLLYPVSVQGEFSAGEIEAALHCLNGSGLADVIVIARGGGSLEDLAACSTVERIARAIVASQLPVVSAVGHETDFTIADFAADLRAPTPSAAAELITEAQHNIAEHLARLNHRLERAARFQILQAQQRLARGAEQPRRVAHGHSLHRLEQRMDDLGFRMENASSSADALATTPDSGAHGGGDAPRSAPAACACAGSFRGLPHSPGPDARTHNRRGARTAGGSCCPAQFPFTPGGSRSRVRAGAGCARHAGAVCRASGSGS